MPWRRQPRLRITVSLCRVCLKGIDGAEVGSAIRIAQQVAKHEITAVELCDAALTRLRDDSHNAVLTLVDDAIEQARRVDQQARRGVAGPLAGVPIAIKDNICVRASRTTCGSRVLSEWVAPYDATAITRLRAAGAVLVAKTNMDEFAMGSSNENSAFGPVRNPLDPARVPGGSSGGSAAAVAANWVPIALGSDTGGSVRQPAAFCGVVGLKPTYGRVSRYGLVAFASSLDQIGPIGSDVCDVARVLEVLAGRDPRDATSADKPVVGYERACASPASGLAGLRIGVVRDRFDLSDAGVAGACFNSLEALANTGATLIDVSLPSDELALGAYYLIATAEASSNLARFDGVRFGYRAAHARGYDDLIARSRSAFGAEVKRRIMLGTFALSHGYSEQFYERALRIRALVRNGYREAFAKCDVLALPSAPTVAFELGLHVHDPVAMYRSDLFTVGASLAGLPALSVPAGTCEGLPVGLQFVAPAFEEARLFQAAAAVEALVNA